MSWSREWHNLNSNQQSVIMKRHESYPVKLGEIANEFGLKVKVATLSANISGQIKEQDGLVTIKVNRHDVKARQRYTLAHEISHFLLHRHLLKHGITDDVLYRSSQSDTVEREADRLAADIIMPMQLVDALFRKLSPVKKGEELYEAIAGELDVSTTALKIRLDKLK